MKKTNWLSRRNGNIVGFFLLFAAIGSITRDPIFSLLLIVVSLIITPKFWDFISQKTRISLSKNNRISIAVVLILIGGQMNLGTTKDATSKQENTTETTAPKVSKEEKAVIGGEAYLRLPGITDQKQVICLGTTREDYTAVTKSILAKDYLGLLEIPGAFCVGNGSKVQVIDQTFGVRRVRIIEGVNEVDKDKVLLSGWVAMEFVSAQ